MPAYMLRIRIPTATVEHTSRTHWLCLTQTMERTARWRHH